jgi:SnoaL-like domain
MEQTLEARLRRLEDIEEIRALKSRYFQACDRKDAKGMRACFKDGTVHIDYGAVGKFDNADALAEVFQQVGCHDYMVEMHHGMNPQIEMFDATRARGTWKLHYFLINTRDRSATQLGGYYEDEYQVVNGAWKISRTRFVATSTLAMDLGEGIAKILFAGRVPPAA